ncbi:thiazole tautomerase (transcriptional regulator TenI) [Sporosarcina luteola]|nr:thiazole tautomerase (transcriptional regulator TenI) [Sporosarcina luteola]
MEFIVVTNDRLELSELVKILIEIEPYMDSVILREKSKTDCELIELIATLAEQGVPHEKLIVNGRANLAAVARVDQVQLPSYGTPLPLISKKFPSIRFGKSIHSQDDAKQARLEGAQWLLYGHLYTTHSKPGLPGRGTDELKQIIDSVDVPVYAIGGIQPNHLNELSQLGVAGVAIMSAVFDSSDPVAALLQYRKEWERGDDIEDS